MAPFDKPHTTFYWSARSGPVVPRDTGGITVQWPSVTGRSFITAFLLDRCKSYAVVHE